MPETQVELCVIGAGSGGSLVASAAARLGRRVVLIDADASHQEARRLSLSAFVAAARVAQGHRLGSALGVEPSSPHVDATRLRQHVRDAVSVLHSRMARLEGVTTIRKEARFLDSKTLDAADTRIKARHFVIATGTRAAIPDVPGLGSVPFFTLDTVFEKDVLPRHLIVLGGGSTGIVLAQAHRRLGSDVTVIDNARLLSRYEPHFAQILLDQVMREGVALRDGAKISRIEPTEAGIRAEIGRVQGNELVEGSHLLVAAGRTANIASLDLAKAKVVISKAGIVVDDALRTSNKRIYAIGDVTGAPGTGEVARWHAGLIIRRLLLGQPVHSRHDTVPRVLNSDPEIATVGLTVADAKEKGLAFEVATATLDDASRGWSDRVGESRIDVLIDKNERVLGASLIAPYASELIVPWVMAISEEIPLSRLAGLIVPYPSFGDHVNRVTSSYYSVPLSNSSARRSRVVLADAS